MLSRLISLFSMRRKTVFSGIKYTVEEHCSPEFCSKNYQDYIECIIEQLATIVTPALLRKTIHTIEIYPGTPEDVVQRYLGKILLYDPATKWYKREECDFVIPYQYLGSHGGEYDHDKKGIRVYDPIDLDTLPELLCHELAHGLENYLPEELAFRFECEHYSNCQDILKKIDAGLPPKGLGDAFLTDYSFYHPSNLEPSARVFNQRMRGIIKEVRPARENEKAKPESITLDSLETLHPDFSEYFAEAFAAYVQTPDELQRKNWILYAMLENILTQLRNTKK